MIHTVFGQIAFVNTFFHHIRQHKMWKCVIYRSLKNVIKVKHQLCYHRQNNLSVMHIHLSFLVWFILHGYFSDEIPIFLKNKMNSVETPEINPNHRFSIR